ncbi:hypothetical protein NMG60_11001345 [Bertholletia excelsa]
MVFATILVMSVNGATYLFGIYPSDIKSSLGYDQTTLNLVSFFKVFSDLINEVTPLWVVLLVGPVMNFFGYFRIWLAVTGRLARPRVWQMCPSIWVGADSRAFANTGSLVTCVHSFPQGRGIVLGLMKGFVGLSGAIIMTQIYHAIHGNDSEYLILLIGCLPAAISIVFLRTIRVLSLEHRRENDLRVFYNLLYVSLGLAGFLMGIIIAQNRVEFSRTGYVGSASVVLFLLLTTLIVTVKEEFNESKKSKVVLPARAWLEAAETQEKPASCSNSVFNPPERGEDFSILQAVFCVDTMILFFTAFCGISGTLTAIDNLGQIGKSLGYPNAAISTFLSLVSIWNNLRRVGAGFVCEIFLIKYNLPRPLLLTLVLLLSCLGHLLIAFALPNSLYFASVVIGFCFGALWPLIFATISDIFGLRYYSTLFQLGPIASQGELTCPM